MPTYIVTNIDTNETSEKFCSWGELETFLKENPNFKKELTTPKIISGIEGKTFRVDNGFTENMQRISEAHPNSPMAEKFGTNRTNKDKKTFNAVKKRTSIGKAHNMNKIAKEFSPGQLVK
jgi:hypothetical protein|tara:strand:+ start:538 stop:897 length:360 start_codon:yes stop_codon:yes gene_type:complete